MGDTTPTQGRTVWKPLLGVPTMRGNPHMGRILPEGDYLPAVLNLEEDSWNWMSHFQGQV